MKRSKVNLIVDVLAFIGFVWLTTTGVLMRYLLPPGSGHGSSIWSLDRHQWGSIHFWLSVVFFSILAVHLTLHWKWIVSVVTRRPREGSGFRAGLGVVGLLAIVGFAISPLLTPVQKSLSDKTAPSLSSLNSGNFLIQGSMTFQDVEDTTGVPVAYILDSLHLPESISAGEKISFLKRQYGFEINDVRETIRAYKNKKVRNSPN